MNHREYKDVFLLQDINIKMHKMMILMCSATLNRLEKWMMQIIFGLLKDAGDSSLYLSPSLFF
jgi:hypothetical protein